MVSDRSFCGPAREQRRELVHLFKHFPVRVSGTRPFEEAIITAGQRSGAIGNPGDPHQLYLSSAYLYEGLQFMWCLKRGDFDWRAQLREGLTALWQVKA